MKKIWPKDSHRRGFTLVELMIVVFIIALLTGIVVTNLSTSRGKSRDTKRISDLGQIQLALELYYDRCKQYPAALNTSSGCTVAGVGIPLSNYISTIPSRPEGGSYDYVTSGNPPVDYILHATLENTNELLKDGISESNKGSYSVTCYDSTSHPNDYCLGPK